LRVFFPILTSNTEQTKYMNTIRLGRYRHFKGNDYEVIGTAKDTESLNEYVVYKALYGKQELWIRPLTVFFETIERDGKQFQRFEYIEDSL